MLNKNIEILTLILIMLGAVILGYGIVVENFNWQLVGIFFMSCFALISIIFSEILNENEERNRNNNKK